MNLALKTTHFHINLKQILYFHCYLIVLLVLLLSIPKSVNLYYETRTVMISIGLIGMWRYSWWMTHVIRSLLYGYFIFPRRRLKADLLWASGWRPPQLFIMMTTFNEIPETTEKVLQTILDESESIGVPTKLFIGIGSEFDENVIENFIHQKTLSIPFEIVLVRQTLPGKRFAISDTLKVIIKNGLTPDDPVIFMDGDTYFMPGCLKKCLPFFPLLPDLQALTTYEQAIILNGPLWMQKWLEMRFAQRDFTMQSYSFSDKIMTLTGRMSIFRGKYLLEPQFIQVIENDHLDHWLWGRYRFLSGDDKSTWYYLLKSGGKMIYIPDATTITIENIKGNPLDRMIENLRRWSGNTLRNGARAIALGPKRVGFFIWWCLIDQRIAIWTMLAGHLLIVITCFTKTPAFIFIAIIWIAFSRLCTSCVLFYYARRIDITFPFLLYLNQIISALIKVYILFRLPQQKWKNRGDQRAGFSAESKINIKSWIANYLTIFYCLSLILIILLSLHLIHLPTYPDLLILSH